MVLITCCLEIDGSCILPERDLIAGYWSPRVGHLDFDLCLSLFHLLTLIPNDMFCFGRGTARQSKQYEDITSQDDSKDPSSFDIDEEKASRQTLTPAAPWRRAAVNDELVRRLEDVKTQIQDSKLDW